MSVELVRAYLRKQKGINILINKNLILIPFTYRLYILLRLKGQRDVHL